MEKILRLLADTDSAAVIEELAARPDNVAAAKEIHQTMRYAYWKQKDLGAAIILGRIGVQYSLSSAAGAGDEFSGALRSAAKAMCYDLASFTWPGWDEKGIAIGPSDLAVGLDAGKANLRLAVDLSKGDLALSRACWMLGGQYLARGEYQRARELYDRAATYAVAAKTRADELLGVGFGHLTELLRSPDDGEASRRIDEIKLQLKPLEDGEMFIGQIEAAGRVFGAEAARSGV
jgi:tetratricopeptide (TPR) repeat protein